MTNIVAPSHKKPSWLRVKAPSGKRYQKIKKELRLQGLATVCEEARCPNIGECWSGGTATIMVMGDTCTRGCRFCSVKTGNPKGALDPLEPYKTARMIRSMETELHYIVITTVDRDDLPDQGADHFRKIIVEVKRQSPSLLIEALAQDFQGKIPLLKHFLKAPLDVFAHNVESVSRLSPKVRDPRASYSQSLNILEAAKSHMPSLVTKSSLMLGLGESQKEIKEAMEDLRRVGVDIVTFGQYLRPSKRQLPVERFVSPEEFKDLQVLGEEMGFAFVASGPLVRSSYRAGEFYIKAFVEKHQENYKKKKPSMNKEDAKWN